MNSRSERRQNPRHALNGRLMILWQDGAGGERICGAHCIDISDTGLKLRIPDKLPSRAMVLFNSPEIGIAGRGTVRFCRPERAAYEVGLECPSGTSKRTIYKRLRNEIRNGL